MLSRWLVRIKINPDTLRQQKWFALFGERLLTPALWQGGTRALSGAVAAGLFASWIPVPMHSLVAVGLALAFSLNLPLALLALSHGRKARPPWKSRPRWYVTPLVLCPAQLTFRSNLPPIKSLAPSGITANDRMASADQ